MRLLLIVLLCFEYFVFEQTNSQLICADTRELCSFWARLGECVRNANWMAVNCMQSCNLCDPVELLNPAKFLQKPVAGQVLRRRTTATVNDILQGNFEDTGSIGIPAAANAQLPSLAPPFLPVGKVPVQQSLPAPPLFQPVLAFAVQQQPASSFQSPNSFFEPRRQPQLQSQFNSFQRCVQIAEASLNNTADVMVQERLVMPFEDVSRRPTLSSDQVKEQNEKSGCVPEMPASIDCLANICYHMMFRTLDGSCNNFFSPLAGAADTPHFRNLPAVYDDGVGAPVGSLTSKRPNPRDISEFVLRSGEVLTSDTINSLVMQWGQFLAHDFVKTTLAPTNLCKNTPCGSTANGRCLPIAVNPQDRDSQHFCDQKSGGCCIKNTRATPICGTGFRISRLQLNENTAFIDGSQLYGSSVEDSRKFRVAGSGFMRVEVFENRHFMPFDRKECPGRGGECKADFKAGDDRVNVFLGLAAMHTLFLREHNRVASQLGQLNRHWDGERLFQETRKIVGALIQAITFKEFLPKIFGAAAFAQQIGNYSGEYKANVNPAIAAEFSGAAFRFGHGMINNAVERITGTGNVMNSLHFNDAVLASDRMLMEGGVDPIIRGLLMSPVKLPQRFSIEPTDTLFGNQDLCAINIERGRDMGLQGYNAWRQLCGLKGASNFSEFASEMFNPLVVDALQRTYLEPNDVDLYVGALLEDPLPDGLVGPTLTCLIGDQFRRLRDGDRFWYQRPGVFSSRQLVELEKASLARLICDNGDNFQFVPPDAFQFGSFNQFVSCLGLPFLDLSAWIEQ